MIGNRVRTYQTCLTYRHRTPCQSRGMDMSRMTRREIETLLRLLAEMEREEFELIVREWKEAELSGQVH
jgi:hypothetical protein